MCNREAPGVEQFAQQHRDTLTVLGLGTQDTFGEAQQFRDRYGISFPFVWDASFTSWQKLGIPSQPASILFLPQGKELGRWNGKIPESQVLELVANS